jgi:hypothetical protein
MRGSIPPPQYGVSWCLVKHRNKFTFTILIKSRRLGCAGRDSWEMRSTYKILVWKSERKGPLEGPRQRRNDSIVTS